MATPNTVPASAPPVEPGALLNVAVEDGDLPNDPGALQKMIGDDVDETYAGVLSDEIKGLEGYDWLTGQAVDPASKPDPDPVPDPAPDPATDPATDPAKSSEPDPAPEAKPDAKPDAKDPDPDPAPGAKPDADPDPAILTPDGKGTIPYSTLQRERAAARALEAELAALKEKYEPTGKPGETDPAAARADPEPEDAAAHARELQERIQAIRDVHGDDIADAFQGMAETNDRLSAAAAAQKAELEAVKGREAARETEAAERTQDALQAAVDANPLVRGWLDDAIAAGSGEAGKSGTMYAVAASIYEELAQSDEFRDASESERLNEVVRLVRGDSALAGAPEDPSQTEDPAGQPDPAKADPKAAADPAKPGAEPAPAPAPKAPESLSDLPSGEPHQSARERLEHMSPAEMEQAVLSGKMSLEALEGLLLTG